MRVAGSKAISECLLKNNVDTIFCYPGGSVIPLFDTLGNYTDKIHLILSRHEQGCIHAADAYARSTGKTGVALVTSGPGATNTITGIATAFLDSVPLLIICGQVQYSSLGTDAFQEVDITGITLPIVKTNFLINSIDNLVPTFKSAFNIAISGRPGPVLIDLPVNIQIEEIDFDYSVKPIFYFNEKKKLLKYQKDNPINIKNSVNLIEKSEKPLVISGGGINISNASNLLNEFINKYNFPIVNTLLGNGIKPNDERLYYGGIGMHGSRYANYAIQESDLIIALGLRFSDRILGDIKRFAPKAKIVHVDIDPAEIEKNIHNVIPIVSDVKDMLEYLLENVDKSKTDTISWINELQNKKLSNPLTYDLSSGDCIKPQYIIDLLNKYFPKNNTIIVSDVGQNQMWVSQFYRFKYPRTHLTSGGLGTMGYSLPASIGAKIANPNKIVVMISGDGGFQMNIQELMTIKRYNLDIKMIVLDNQSLGMVKQWQKLFCESRFVGTPMDDNPDFAKIAEAIGIRSIRLDKIESVENAIKDLSESNESVLIHAIVDPEENVLPMVPKGESLDNSLIEI